MKRRPMQALARKSNLRTLIRRRIEGYVATGRQKHGTKAAMTKRKLKSGTLVARMSTKLKRAGYRSRYRLRKQIVEPDPPSGDRCAHLCALLFNLSASSARASV
ncbi:hypothetical protein ACVWWI_006493 [Bradyrhizobium sp. USDA 3686]|uniref:hypothetical protein n=1 Tax=Bradyrhizobium canariense TaxID=255045 RepID=UPI00195CEBDC|nr:hypothetical protein [Bradyrhizobium canariense]MBM7487959.1 hypothetical protein [Bradyrhizobium canariense]